jgi:hypothetical protein
MNIVVRIMDLRGRRFLAILRQIGGFAKGLSGNVGAGRQYSFAKLGYGRGLVMKADGAVHWRKRQGARGRRRRP